MNSRLWIIGMPLLLVSGGQETPSNSHWTRYDFLRSGWFHLPSAEETLKALPYSKVRVCDYGIDGWSPILRESWTIGSDGSVAHTIADAPSQQGKLSPFDFATLCLSIELLQHHDPVATTRIAPMTHRPYTSIECWNGGGDPILAMHNNYRTPSLEFLVTRAAVDGVLFRVSYDEDAQQADSADRPSAGR